MNLLVWVKDFFVPHSRNNHRAKLLQPGPLTVIVALFLVTQFGLNYFSFVSPSVLGFASNIAPEQVVTLTNQKRLENGLKPLEINETLNEVAQRKAGDMFAFNYWAHTSPSGRDPWSFFQEVGYRYIYAGENLARDFMDSGAVVNAWMASPSHKDNILNSKYDEIGLAVVNGTLNGVETTLVVQVFGTPTPAPRVQSLLPQVGEARATTVSGQQTDSLISHAGEVSGSQLVSPFSLTKTIVVFLLGLFVGGLLIDAFLVYKKKVIRLSSKNMAHLIFVGVLLAAVFITNQGMIL